MTSPTRRDIILRPLRREDQYKTIFMIIQRASRLLALGVDARAFPTRLVSLKHRGDARPPGEGWGGGRSCSAAPSFKDHLFWSLPRASAAVQSDGVGDVMVEVS